jgi:hypothetical protein
LSPKDSAVSIQNIRTASAYVDDEELTADWMAIGKQWEYASISRTRLINNYVSDSNLRPMGRDKFSLSGFNGFFGSFGGNASSLVGSQQKIALRTGNEGKEGREYGQNQRIETDGIGHPKRLNLGLVLCFFIGGFLLGCCALWAALRLER